MILGFFRRREDNEVVQTKILIKIKKIVKSRYTELIQNMNQMKMYKTYHDFWKTLQDQSNFRRDNILVILTKAKN